MIHLPLPSKAFTKFIGPVKAYHIVFNLEKQQFEWPSFSERYVNKIAYDWMLEYIGYPMFATRLLDLPVFEEPNEHVINADIPKSSEDWDRINPLLTDKPSTWYWHKERLYFTDIQYATLFKLSWF